MSFKNKKIKAHHDITLKRPSQPISLEIIRR